MLSSRTAKCRAFKQLLWSSSSHLIVNLLNVASYSHLRVTIRPRRRLLQLPGELEQRCFVAEGACELYANRQTVAVPEEWQVHSRLSGDILEGGERDVVKERQEALHDVGLLHVKDAESHWRRSKRGRQPQIVNVVKRRRAPARALKRIFGDQIFTRADAFAELVHAPGERFELLRLRRFARLPGNEIDRRGQI